MTPNERRAKARALRQDSGMSYGQIAEVVGVSRQRVAQYINDDIENTTRGRPTKPCPVSGDELADMIANNTRGAVCDLLECSPYLLHRWEADLVTN